jgi:hypothetical protein
MVREQRHGQRPSLTGESLPVAVLQAVGVMLNQHALRVSLNCFNANLF